MRFVPAPGLERKVAAMVAAPVTRLAQIAADGMKAAAPDDKVWITMDDPVVRDEHAAVHGHAVPENLRFTLDSPAYDMAHYGVGEQQMGRAPRDEAFTPGLTENCRCELMYRSGIADAVTPHAATVEGSRVTARVTVEHHLCVTAEYGTGEDQGARYAVAGLRQAGRRLRR